MLVWHGEPWLIDHGASLYFHHAWNGWEKAMTSSFPYIKDHVFLGKASRLHEADEISTTLLTPAKLGEIVELVPDNWLAWESDDLSPAKRRDIYKQFLVDRLNNSQIFLKQAVDARKKLI